MQGHRHRGRAGVDQRLDKLDLGSVDVCGDRADDYQGCLLGLLASCGHLGGSGG